MKHYEKYPVFTLLRVERKNRYTIGMENFLRMTLALKMIGGFIVAYFIANLFNLDYSFTAGVIAVLSLALTKEAVIKQAIIRLSASLFGIGVSALAFFVLGYHLLTLILIVAIVIISLYIFKFEIGIVLALVLISQEYIGGDVSYALNAIYILLIGVGIALILNLYTPTPKKIIDQTQQRIDQEISLTFAALNRDKPHDFIPLKTMITHAQNDLALAKQNREMKDIQQRISYLGMREYQVLALERISTILNRLEPSIYKQKIIDFLGRFVNRIGTANFASEINEELTQLLVEYQQLPLPLTRPEFEHRAELFHVLNELEQFLAAKISFHQQFDQ